MRIGLQMQRFFPNQVHYRADARYLREPAGSTLRAAGRVIGVLAALAHDYELKTDREE